MKKLAATVLLALRVRPSGRFAVRQLRGTPRVHEYELRATRRRVLIRHDGGDPHVLAECFGRLAAYEPPPRVAALLAANPPATVLDLGANIGLFGLLALDRFPGCRVTGFEADPANAALHERCIELNGLAGRWALLRAFASNREGLERFAAGRSSRSHAAGPGETAVEVEAIDVLPRLSEADLVKIDIEGAEWALLGDPRLGSAAAKAIVLEYHGHGCPSDDPGEAASAALAKAGYSTLITSRNPSPADEFEGYGTLWAWREDR